MLVDMRPVESSENITIMDEIDELLGTRRSYGWNSGSRPSMISAKYRLKEERRKVLKISVNKMKKIDDAESSLCRSVLINNTVKRLQAETRDDRTTGRTSPASPPSPTSTGYHGYHSPQLQAQPCGGGGTGGGNPQLVDITNLRESSPNGVGPGGVGTNGTVVGVCKTLANNNNNNINNNNNNTTTKPMMMDVQSSSLTAADHHHHHHHQHLNHSNNSLHNHPHHHHHHQNHHHHHHHLHQSHLHQNHHHHHNFHQTHHTSVSGCSLPVQYSYEDVEDEDDDTIASIMMQLPSSTAAGGQSSSPCLKRRRPSVDEPLDDLLSQFICNNNQREDEDVNVVDLDLHEYPAAKRLRTDEAAAAAAAVAAATAASVTSTTTSSSVATADLCSSDCWSLMDTSCCDDTLDLYGGQVPAAVEHQDVLLPAAAAQSATDCCPLSSSSSSLTTLTSSTSASSSTHQDDHFGVSSTVAAPASGSTSPTSLSCGQASMFSEMQSAMFRNLIASLES